MCQQCKSLQTELKRRNRTIHVLVTSIQTLMNGYLFGVNITDDHLDQISAYTDDVTQELEESGWMGLAEWD